jgi:hypothetical protein
MKWITVVMVLAGCSSDGSDGSVNVIEGELGDQRIDPAAVRSP